MTFNGNRIAGKLAIGLLVTLLFSQSFLYQSPDSCVENEWFVELVGDGNPSVGTESDHSNGHHDGSSHEPNTNPLLFVIIAVFIGAATRHFLQRIPVPFTALLLIFGIALGALTRMGAFETWAGVDVSFLADSFQWAAYIDPHMLFFIFLPILIFEAAFALDLHTFKKSAANSVILAVPGILIAMLLSAAMVYVIDVMDIGLEGWANWSLALMFGAVISATDPVAVVALLKELGAGKKLGTLIEGESLLNDGTAIVLFMVFFLGISGQASDANGFVEFARVSFGGLAVGGIVGGLTMRWIRSVFNDALVEISIVLAAAFFTFYIAEHFMHVSGVLALVALGLMVGGFGRSGISPEVEHFMHEFWELAGFIANCIIFLIVGIVIALRIEFTANDFLILGIVYVGIHVGRAVVMVVLYPFMKNTGYGLPVKDAIVVWYGALRGAIALALALIVAGVDPNVMSQTLDVSPERAQTIKDQFLFLIAGTVTLTLLVNATTIQFLIKRLGILDIPPVKAFMLKSAGEYLRDSTENHMHKLREDRNLKKANWNKVAQYLPDEIVKGVGYEDLNIRSETVAEHRRRLLEKEKSSYRKQFKEGMLSAEAVKILTENVNDILDEKGASSLSDRKELEKAWRPSRWLTRFQSWPVVGKITENAFFEELLIGCDCASGFVKAQQDCLDLLRSMNRAEGDAQKEQLAVIEQEINGNIISGLTFMRNLRNTYPEIFKAIATRQAIRSMLNYELQTVNRLRDKGRLDSSEAAKLTHLIEERLKQLKERPPRISFPETATLLDSVPWVSRLDKATKEQLIKLCHSKIYSTGQTILKPGSASPGLLIIARGNVRIMDGAKTAAVLGKGDILGELALVKASPGKHRAIAEDPVTVLRLSSANASKLLEESPEFSELVGHLAAVRLAENAVAIQPEFSGIDRKLIRRVAAEGNPVKLPKGGEFRPDRGRIYVLCAGACHSRDEGEKEFAVGDFVGHTDIYILEDSVLWEMEMPNGR